jgi:hypothetical protein
MTRTLPAAFMLTALFGLMSTRSPAADPPAVQAAEGLVEKFDKDVLTVQPRGPDGKFGKAVALKVTGTSRVAVLSLQSRGGKDVLVQKEIEAKDLKPKQALAVIYAETAGGPVLLSAVAHPAPEK